MPLPNRNMTESKFVNQNKEQWNHYLMMVGQFDRYSPTELGNAYLSICTDLAFAQTHYPETGVCRFLNSLAQQYHQILYRRQPQRWRQLMHFFGHDVPLSFYHSRKYILLAFCIFLLGEVMGILSQVLDKDYFEWFFGASYYHTTLDNIGEGNPMGIYQDPNMWNMYFKIAVNNIIVGLRFFINGLLSPFYVIYKDLETGIMDGCFTTFFFQHGYGIDALIAPNEHGAIELPACIVCNAAGLQLGMGWLFPGKRSRFSALIHSARKSVIMAAAMIPAFAFAALIESFITRYQDLPLFFRILIVMFGLVAVIYYLIILPRYVARNENMEI